MNGAVKITDAEVIVTCPGRNFVTMTITVDEGLSGAGDVTLKGREPARLSAGESSGRRHDVQRVSWFR